MAENLSASDGKVGIFLLRFFQAPPELIISHDISLVFCRTGGIGLLFLSCIERKERSATRWLNSV